MVERLISEVTAAKEMLRGTLAGQRNLEARLSVTASFKIRCGGIKELANGLLAASAENPRLLDPVRAQMAAQWEKLKATSEDPEAALIAWLAVEGLSSLEMHDLSPVSPKDRDAILSAVYRLLDKGIAK
jgi:hypothetical protein